MCQTCEVTRTTSVGNIGLDINILGSIVDKTEQAQIEGNFVEQGKGQDYHKSCLNTVFKGFISALPGAMLDGIALMENFARLDVCLLRNLSTWWS